MNPASIPPPPRHDPVALLSNGRRRPSSQAEPPPSLAPDDDQIRALFDSASDLVLVLEPAGMIVFANRAARDTVGTEEGDLEGHSLYDIVHPYDHAALQAWLQRHAAGHPTAPGDRIRLVFRSPDGRDISVEGSATQHRQGGRVNLLHAMFLDLSEPERDARAHRETTEILQLLSQHAPWGVFITDPVGRLRFANRHWRALADVLHVPIPRGVWWQMVHPADRERILAQWQSALNGGHEFAAEFRANTPDPEPRWVRTRIAQSWTHDGQRGACVGISEDVTLQRQADDVLRKSHEHLEAVVRSRTEELHETNRELTDLIYAVTHDLKAPLRGINRLTDWLAEDHAAHLPPEGSALIVKMQTRVRHLHTLIDGILAYTRIAREYSPDVTVDLNAVVREVTRLLDPPPRFTIAVPEPLPIVSGVPYQLHQLFQNLLDNAMKFMDKPKGRAQITCRRTGPAWEVSISDNGPGIPARFHEKVFSLFQRLDAVPDRPGAGIGLALVKRIVETRGGQITLASEEGHGTTFLFTWPDQPRRPKTRSV